MATVWRGCSTSCDFTRSSVRHGEESCLSSKNSASLRISRRNGSRCGSHMLPMQLVSSMFMARTCLCSAASRCLESHIADKEEIRMTIWSRCDEFDTNDYDDHEQHPVSPVITEERDADDRNMPPPVDSGRKCEHSARKLHFLEERDEEMLSKRLIKLSRSNKVRSAVELFASMRASGLRPNGHAYNSLLSSLVRKSSLDDALKLFEVMKKEKIAAGHTYTFILKAVAGAQGYLAALKLFDELEEEDSSKKILGVIVYNAMISICARAKDWKQAAKMWRKLRHNLISGTLLTYDLLVSTFVQCGQSELAIDAYHEMLQNGLEPSEDIMKAIIASCTKDGKWELAFAAFRRMLSSGIKPNIISFNSIINSLGKAGQDERAFRMYHLLTASGLQPDTYTWSALLSALYRSNRYLDALDLFQGIKAKHHSLLNSHLYNIALMSCERLGQWEHALQLLWMMENSGMQMSAASYNHVIRTCEVANKPKVALEVYRHMIHRRCSSDIFTHLSVIRACIWGSLWNEVEDILEEVVPDSSIFNAAIHWLSLRGNIKLARKVCAKMQSIGLKPDTRIRAFMLQHFTEGSTENH